MAQNVNNAGQAANTALSPFSHLPLSTSVLGGLQEIIVAGAPQIDGTLQTVGVVEPWN